MNPNIISTLSLAIACIVSLGQPSFAQITYSGYSLLKAIPQDDVQLDELRQLATSEELHGIDFWLPPSVVGRDVSILVDPESKSSVIDYLKSNNISAIETIEDIGEQINNTEPSSTLNRQFEFLGIQLPPFVGGRPIQQQLGKPVPQAQDSFFANYQRYESIEKRLSSYAQKPEVQVKRFGYSHQNRSLYLVQVSSDPSKNKPVILIDAGHHAREWISHSTLMFMLDNLLRDSSRKDKNSIGSKLEAYDFWFVPAVNPDGYEWAHKHDRLWRKTRTPGRMCSGADPNRNYNEHWAKAGASRDECSQIYAGKGAESEIEVKLMSQMLYENRKRIVMYLSLHSFSQLILWPYGYANVAPSNEQELRLVAGAGVAGIQSYRGTTYSAGRVADVLYAASGGSDDYAMSVCKIRFVYTIELPDKGWRGFVLPTSEIIPVGVETERGVAAMIDRMDSLINNSQ